MKELAARTAVFIGISIISGLFAPIAGAQKFSKGERLFALKVKPLLSEKCFSCHGEDPDKIKGDLDMLSLEGLLRGGESSDEVLVPGDANASLMFTAVKWEDPDYEMPPKENDRLAQEQVWQIRNWINEGAPWPSEEDQERIRSWERKQEVTEDGILVDTSGGLTDGWTYRRYKPEDVWSFRPVEKPEVSGGSDHPIDTFIGARLSEAGLKPAPQADPNTLVRRASFDLIGLPPTPGEISAFVAAWKKNPEAAWSDLIDRLLASPRYGERWAQHWLDVVRYADTSGYSNDFERSNAWRYRDYVIRSLNADKPYPRFILEQIAGDELEPDNPEMKVAVGFLRMGPWEHTAMTPDVVSRQLWLDDATNAIGQTFLSTTMRCLKCHDHKFDPLPTKDYYRMYAALATTQLAEVPAPYLDIENRKNFEVDRRHVETLLETSIKRRDEIYAKREAAAREWYRERGKPYLNAEKRKSLKGAKPARHVGLTTSDQGELKLREGEVKIWTRRLERYEPLAQSVYSGGDLYPKSIKLRLPSEKQQEESEKYPVSHIYEGGSVYARGDKVTPGVLSALGLESEYGSDADFYALAKGMSKRRLSLARWIADPENPLMTRSIVNRVWHYHFGRGIAGNPNNFGATGKRPTHPALLDWLAATFIEDGGSLKKLHKRIMTSEAYLRGSAHPDLKLLDEKDPDNELLSFFEPRRMTAEELRDTMLALTGELNLEMGGLPIKPEINMEVALSPRMLQFSLAPAYQPSRTPAERNRRSIYAYRVRGLSDPMLEVFNKPNSDDSCESRDAPNVTPQVFTLLNSDVVTTRSLAFAKRLEEERATLKERIVRAYRLSLARVPTGAELAKLEAHYGEMVAYHRANPPESVDYPTRVTRSLVEEFSGDPFEYEERLDVYEDYVPDVQAADVPAETRALADICMLLFNTNEFIYVY
uniref:Secreted protein n=1 Tax=uncultured bacterium 12-5D TaxID=1497524 RepID=A0A059U272_9BACT|nr:secreted protein [uncultured bacterium 12-5D]